ncbi:MAG: hypothetical protein A3B89_04295 [Candidatus Buchananbacteria bacterium RIFCSPHIGHO2_02_FULL_40_13]|uniref:Uncharacterized protein n=1 Tax=Candidatus Buchananbacteria bacterium RIFCSPLOWO2_01_FULL_39_33 TaxID=1797543 RepID=A0A1G1YKT4_9BACT|nr:MAG: hypothetical protein A2820_02000 [Candidatus Buchananbacteria bacterium RIFCSPHIGHO2_01_FULL_40_35]OGY50898.1 MAG: hypothetical protein A3B89_04295 [Candidatus Buchananbacteria bacterium RIFCSPHIGHO2_02_FULL_40_13]OGY52965.1 MAG: hypothetical protein A3A02_04470 [Candidatus Buchananbacteria bacterium RIFCSPLOWO2_01_FULL_39_33]
MKKIKIKNISFFKIVGYLYPATILAIVLVLLFLIRFLYANVYQTIIQAELITDLRKEVSEQNLEKEKFDKVLENLNWKTTITGELTAVDLTKDPFQNLPVGEIPKTP